MILVFQLAVNIILFLIILFLLKQIDMFNHLKKNYSTIIILQKIMEIIGKKISSEGKIKEINDILINDYSIMFSTIVSYTEGRHKVKASNVDTVHHTLFLNIADEAIFKPNTQTGVPKYATTGSGLNLKYCGAEGRGIKSAMFLPLFLDEKYAGYWLLEDKRPNAFDRLEKVQLSILKNNLGLIIENSNYQSAIEKMAVSDRLTGLYNRNYLYTTGKEILNIYPFSSVAICDIDFFKKVNDTYGHDIGDKVLVNVARVTSDSLSEKDVMVRFGGEEFVIIFPGKDIKVCRIEVEKIRETISQSIVHVTSDKSLSVTVSYGMSTFQKGEDLDAAIKKSDVALYRAKESGRNRVEIA